MTIDGILTVNQIREMEGLPRIETELEQLSFAINAFGKEAHKADQYIRNLTTVMYWLDYGPRYWDRVNHAHWCRPPAKRNKNHGFGR
jgi:hypothetical protein